MNCLNLVCKISTRYRPFQFVNKFQLQRNLCCPNFPIAKKLEPKCVIKACCPSKWDVRGKNVVITGGARGILFEASKQIIKCGACRVAIWDTQDEDSSMKSLKEDFPCREIKCMKVDVSQKSEIDEAFKTIMHQWKHIDVLIAGSGTLEECNLEKTVALNMVGTMNTILGGIDHMSIRKCGHGGIIVVISSVTGLDPIFSIPINTAAYHGVVGFTDTLANEFYKGVTGIQFVTMCPGITDTEMRDGFKENVLFPEAIEVTGKLLDKMPLQSAKTCGINLVKALRESYNGSIWILDDGNYYEIQKTKYWLWEKESCNNGDDSDDETT